MILSVITTDLAPVSAMNASTSFATSASLRMSLPPGEPASQVRDVGIFSWHDGNNELRGRGIVWAVERDGRDGVAAESLLGSLAQPLACAFKHCSSSPRISCRAVGLLLY